MEVEVKRFGYRKTSDGIEWLEDPPLIRKIGKADVPIKDMKAINGVLIIWKREGVPS